LQHCRPGATKTGLATARFVQHDEDMRSDRVSHVARLNKAELSGMPPQWTSRERGQYLRALFRQKGVDPDRLYQVEYHPRQACWLLIQRMELVEQAATLTAPLSDQADELFYVRATDELRRTALAAVGRGSTFLAGPGGKYQLPEKAEEISPADLADLLGGPSAGDPPVRFDGEGRWRAPGSQP
jgi:hypothetical protein